MIRHVVMWKLKNTDDGMSKTEIAEMLKSEILKMKQHIPQILDIDSGLNFSPRSEGYELVLNSLFENNITFEEYMVHPVHEKFKELVGKYRESILVVDYNI